ncbi:MAG: ABC transporter substrate-binding protein [Alphaproteobacteria bacterium]|nr:ABC transporter substrate-binding protein [Alphaproteobacteria bacterium]
MSRQPYFRALGAALLAAAATLAVGDVAAAADVKRGGTLVLARPEEPLTFNPFVPADNGSIYAIEQVCDSLTEADATGLGLRPGLAESWEISADTLTYVFKLRDAQFSNGQPVTVDDVVFSLRTAGGPTAAYAFGFEPILAVEAADDSHVTITLKRPYTPLLSVLSLFAAAIVEKASFEADTDGFGQKPVCSGPFRVEEYARGSSVVMVRNDNYWDIGVDGQPLPYLDRIEMLYVPESNSRVLGLRSGDYDVIASVPFNQARQLEGDSEVTLEAQPIFRLDYVYLNHGKAPLDKKEIRLALNYAADREAILKTVYFGFGEIPNSYMPKVNYHSDTVEQIPYDIEKAKELVAAAGYDGTPIDLMLSTGDAPGKQIATILQQAWQAAGLNVNIVEFESGTAWDMTTKGEYQAYVSYITSDINDTDELAVIQADVNSGTNAFFTWYNNPEVIDLLAKARQSADSNERAGLYAKVQDIAYHDGYSVPLNFVPSVNAYHNYVSGWRTVANGWWWLKDVSVDK